MATYYKVDNRLLSKEEYQDETIWIWGFFLFIIGAVMCGSYVHGHIPLEWSKELRFASVLGSGVLCGGILARAAVYIRMAFIIGSAMGIVAAIGYGVWCIV